MSARLVDAVYGSGLPAWLKLFGAVYASFARREDTLIYPALATVAQRSSRTVQDAREAAEALEALGILERISKGGYGWRSTRVYRFHLEKLPPPPTALPNLRGEDEVGAP